jgi:hypothetical protein
MGLVVDESLDKFLVIIPQRPQTKPVPSVAPLVVTVPPGADDGDPEAKRAMVVFFHRERAEAFLCSELEDGRPFFPGGRIMALGAPKFRRILELYGEHNERLDSLLIEPSPVPTWARDSDEKPEGDIVPLLLALMTLDEMVKHGYT